MGGVAFEGVGPVVVGGTTGLRGGGGYRGIIEAEVEMTILRSMPWSMLFYDF